MVVVTSPITAVAVVTIVAAAGSFFPGLASIDPSTAAIAIIESFAIVASFTAACPSVDEVNQIHLAPFPGPCVVPDPGIALQASL